MNYINLHTKVVNNWSDNEVSLFKTDADIPVSSIKNKLVLVSLNDYKLLDTNDIIGFRRESVKRDIKNGYKALGELSKNYISLNYNICPICAKKLSEVDVSRDLVIDCCGDFNKIKEIKFTISQANYCCGVNSYSRTPITMPVDIRGQILKEALMNGVNVLIRVNVRVENDLYCIYIDFKDYLSLPFSSLTNDRFKDIETLNSDSKILEDIDKLAIYFLDNQKTLRYILENNCFLLIQKLNDMDDSKTIFNKSKRLSKFTLDKIMRGVLI